MRSSVVALLPVKDFGLAKSRLAPHLGPVERSTIARCMVQDVLSVLTCVPGLVTVMVTADAGARKIAAQFKIRTVPDRGSGQSAVIKCATRDLADHGASGSLVIPGDVPALTVEEVEMVLAAGRGRGSVLVPSRSGRGTNAVLRRPPDLFDLQFGDDSFRPHLAKARESGAAWNVLDLSGLGLDIDEVEDLSELLKRPGQTRTHAFLVRSRVAKRLKVRVHERV